MIVAVFPGQGSQTPGFLAPWLEVDGVRAELERYSEAAEVDLISAGTEWDADQIRDTKVAQPLIVAASLVSWNALPAEARTRFGGVAGHSVGEIAALVAAGVLSADDGMRLVGIRGRAMADAAALAESGMSAVVGATNEQLEPVLANLGLFAANFNGGGQIVVAGAPAGLEALQTAVPRGARVFPLQVAGAFHTSFMEPAIATLAEAAEAISPADPSTVLWTNHDGSVVTSGAEALSLLVGQVASPVRWDLCMEGFAARDVTGIIEFAPGGTLATLAKRALRGVPSVPIKTPEDLSAATELLENA